MMNNPNVLISCDYGSIIVNRYDPYLGLEISANGYWAKEDINLIKMIMEIKLKDAEKVVFYDVGANIGTHTLAIAKSLGEKVFVRSFEAQRMMYYMACGTIALNGLFNVEIENVAVSDINGDVIEIQLPDYTKSNNFGGLELIEPKRTDNMNMIKYKKQNVITRTLDSYDEKVDFIKMDIEGMEDRALEGSKELFKRCRHTCFIEILKTDIDYVSNFFKTRNYVGFQKNNDIITIPIEYNFGINNLDRIF